MHAQWNRLLQGFPHVSSDEFPDPFLRRLMIVLSDPRSGTADKVKAYYDALASAHAHCLDAPQLPVLDKTLLPEFNKFDFDYFEGLVKIFKIKKFIL